VFTPYQVDVPFDHRPVMNWVVFAAVLLVFGLQALEQPKVNRQVREEYNKRVTEGEPRIQAAKHAQESVSENTIYRFALKGWGLKGLLGYMWLHGGMFHLIGNLIFLWLFGNAVCSKIGNIFYLPVYIGLGVIAGVSHLLFTRGLVIGASGAINGIVGMYLVFFPENTVSCFLLLFFRPITFSVSGYWMILLWFAFDILGAISGGQGTAYFAHIGGFVAGFGFAILMLKRKWVVMERDEKSLLELLGPGKKRVTGEPRPDFAPWQRQWEIKETEQPQPQTIPTEPENLKEELIRFNCRCGQKIKVAIEHAGKTGRCPKCKEKVKVPEK